ncbi:protein takeout [Aethina tumida]|uniref:protein takeout n=1 Tax=Aethina tumida TaxID=116153 RepID=UPI0021487A76|nr:protein takeout [Aethina tumida]
MNWIKFLVFVAAIVAVPAAKLPSSFGRCHKSDAQFEDCLRKNIEGAIHALAKGAPQLGLNRLEPLEIPSLTIGQGTGPVQVEQNFHDVLIHGLTGSKVEAATADLEKNLITATSLTPELRLEAKYDMSGRVLLLPMVGKGPCNVTLLNTRINHRIALEQYEKNGSAYWKVKAFNVIMKPGKVTYKFDNLFDGQKQLGDEINKVLNDNWSEVFTDVKDGYEKSFGLIFQDLAERVFSRVALKDVFYLD